MKHTSFGSLADFLRIVSEAQTLTFRRGKYVVYVYCTATLNDNTYGFCAMPSETDTIKKVWQEAIV
jgi:hypothetical protein